MAKEEIPELTKQRIRRAYQNGEGSRAALAQRFGVSESSVKRITKGVRPAGEPPQVLVGAIAAAVTDPKSKVTIDGIDINQYLSDGFQELSSSLKSERVVASSLEGVANALLRYIQFYVEMNPPTMESMVDKLLAMPDFDPQKFAALLKERYAQQKAG